MFRLEFLQNKKNDKEKDIGIYIWIYSGCVQIRYEGKKV